MKKSLEIVTLGCKVNQAESEALAAWYRQADGWLVEKGGKKADLCIINTCAVTQRAAMQSRQAVRRAVRENPQAVIAVTGCYAQSAPGELSRIKGVDYIIGHADKHRLAQIVDTAAKPGKTGTFVKAEPGAPVICHSGLCRYRSFDPMPALPVSMRTRPFLKIQDGCDTFCTYCIVPHTRGRSRSLPPKRVLSDFTALVRTGAPEIVLSGIHIGRYGADLSPRTDLLELLKTLDAVDGTHRIRLTSIEPGEITDALLDWIGQSGRICPHFHIPLQSGDPAILEKMKRPYGAETFADRVGKIRRLFPDAAVGADVLIGFPGEDRSAFERTRRLIESLPLTYLHVFPYSPRPGTPAAEFDGRVPPPVVKARCGIIRALGREKNRAFRRQMTGKRLDVVIEEADRQNPALVKGISANYLPVRVKRDAPGGEPVSAMRVTCRIEGVVSDGSLFGVPVSADKDSQGDSGRKYRQALAACDH